MRLEILKLRLALKINTRIIKENVDKMACLTREQLLGRITKPIISLEVLSIIRVKLLLQRLQVR
jgi:hypothetical protein